MRGIVINITDRGFFFIRGEDGRDYFGHKSAMEPRWMINHLEEGDDVIFLPEHAEKGPRASAIRVPRLERESA